MKIYIVQKGDTAHDIAQKNGVSLSALRQLNTSLNEQEKLKPGMKIKVPSGLKPVKRKSQVRKTKEESTNRSPRETQEAIVEKEDQDEGNQVTLNANTYTYKTDALHPPTTPFNDGELDGFETAEGSSVPMMEDPFPDSMKKKEVEPPQSLDHGYGESGIPSYGYQGQPYTYPTYQQGYIPYPQQGEYTGQPYYYEGYPGYSSSTAGQSAGYYSQAPYPYGGVPYRNPLGCRAEEPLSETSYYEGWKQNQEQPYPLAPIHSLDYDEYMAYMEHKELGGELPEAIPAASTFQNSPNYQHQEYGYSAPEEGLSGAYMPPQSYGFETEEGVYQSAVPESSEEVDQRPPADYPFYTTPSQGALGSYPPGYGYHVPTQETSEGYPPKYGHYVPVQETSEGYPPEYGHYVPAQETSEGYPPGYGYHVPAQETSEGYPPEYGHYVPVQETSEGYPPGYGYHVPVQETSEGYHNLGYGYSVPGQGEGYAPQLNSAYYTTYEGYPVEEGVNAPSQGLGLYEKEAGTPYHLYPPYNEGSVTQPHSGYMVSSETQGAYMPYSPYTGQPTAPDYGMWESYVDYHEPPYQPDFPVQSTSNLNPESK